MPSIYMTYPATIRTEDRPIIDAVVSEIESLGFEALHPPKDKADSTTIRNYLRQADGVVAIYLPAANEDPRARTSSWVEATVGAARAGIGAELPTIVIYHHELEAWGLPQADSLQIRIGYVPGDEDRKGRILEALRGRLLALRTPDYQPHVVWLIHLDLIGFTALTKQGGETESTTTDDQVADAVATKRAVADAYRKHQVQPSHIIDTGDGGYLLYEGHGVDATAIWNLALDIRSSLPNPMAVRFALAAGVARRCISMDGGQTFIGSPMNIAARINCSKDGSAMHVDNGFRELARGSAIERELAALPEGRKEDKHGIEHTFLVHQF